MKNIYLSLVVPAYNEEKKIEKDIRRAFAYFKKAKIIAEVIVSTDGVTDSTNKIVKKLQKEFANLKLIAKKEKIGKGAAIKEGVESARGKYIMFADAGYCVPFEFIKDGLKKLEEGFDCALASRASSSSKVVKPQPLYRQIGSKTFGFLVRNLIGIPRNIKDTQCGFKLYRHDVAKDLFGNLETRGFMFDIELILRAKKKKHKMVQFPVAWSNDPDTKFNPLVGSLKNIRELIRIKVRNLF